MAIYICGYCNGMKDDDYNPPEELANQSHTFYDLVCQDCNVNYFNEDGEENESN